MRLFVAPLAAPYARPGFLVDAAASESPDFARAGMF
jgi:hypothetical protein